jgi:preprotein translocase subunit Sec63
MAGTGGQDTGNAVSRPIGGRRDPYEVLSLSRDATEQQIKSTYRKLALK